MFTFEDWQKDKELQRQYDEFYRSALGVAMRDVLMDRMLNSMPQIQGEADAVQREAMSGVFLKGFRQVFKEMKALRPTQEVKPNQVSPSGLPVREDLLKKVRDGMPTK